MRGEYYYYNIDENNVITRGTFEESIMIMGDRPTKPVGSDVICGIRISTIFMAIDHGHNWHPEQVTVYHPTLFETGILDGIEFCNVRVRYRTLNEALKGHQDNIEYVKQLIAKLCKLGSYRRAKKHFDSYERSYLRDWYNKRNHKASKQLRSNGLKVENTLKRLQEEWGCIIRSKN